MAKQNTFDKIYFISQVLSNCVIVVLLVLIQRPKLFGDEALVRICTCGNQSEIVFR